MNLILVLLKICRLKGSNARVEAHDGVVVREVWCQLRCRTRHLTMVHNYEVRLPKSPCVAEKGGGIIH
ncbi:hypothetical protein TNCV_3858291 [Trichonephila clavipes]|nr:hypothetical protein TNCV_3858291 [Trichonephila clavipes]